MGAWDMMIAIPKDTAFLEVADAIENAMARWPDRWDWYAVGGRGWDLAAYIDENGQWHEQGPEQSIEDWRRIVADWRGSVNAAGYRLTTVRCKG
jgi:hypothetical protein